MELIELISTLRDKSKGFFERVEAANVKSVTHHLDTFELSWYTEYEPSWECERTYFFIHNSTTHTDIDDTTAITPDEAWILLWELVVKPGEPAA